MEHGYVGIDPRSKVRYLRAGIKTNQFDAVKTRIMSEERLRSDFDSCVTLYQDYIRQTSKTTGNPTVNISSMNKILSNHLINYIAQSSFTKYWSCHTEKIVTKTLLLMYLHFILFFK